VSDPLLFVLSHFSAVFVVDTGKQCFIWVGRGASIDERRKSMEYAHVSRSRYL